MCFNRSAIWAIGNIWRSPERRESGQEVWKHANEKGVDRAYYTQKNQEARSDVGLVLKIKKAINGKH